MEVALRRSYGYAFSPPLNRYGMGDMASDLIAVGVNPTDAAAYAAVPSSDPGGSTYDQLITQGVLPADAYQYDPAGAIAAGVDPSTLFPITAGAVTPGVALTPAELAAEQSRATSWLATIPGALTTAAKIAALTSAQIAAGIQSGGLKPSSTCPSGYMVAGSAQCTGAAPSTSVFPGVSNTTLAIAAMAFFGLMMMGRKR